jgi:dTDP-4-amino-4,6-dideoxygalactose transaminase
MPVPPLNLAGNFQQVGEEVLAEIRQVCESGHYVLGPKVTVFEEALANYCGSKHALGMSSGTDALLAALMALGVGPGDEVVCPTFTFFGTAGVVARLGATPVFCDIHPATFNAGVEQIEPRINDQTRAIIPVHLYGQMTDVRALTNIAQRRGIPVIEDAAQAIGACEPGPGGKRAGALGTFGALSFYPTKNLGAIGDAGALLTDDPALYEKARKLRIHGSGHTYYHDMVGGNFRIDALQAAILSIKLRHLERWTEQRRARAGLYDEMLIAANLVPEHVRVPRELYGRHVYHQYIICANRRDELLKHLQERKIGAGVYYPLPLHLQKCFAHLGGTRGDFPHAERAAAEVLALPIYPEITDVQQETVVGAIKSFYHA